MFNDVLIPCRIGNYYLYQKKILSFEITPIMISATLLEFSTNTITVKTTQNIMLKDMTTQAQANALKKLASNIGSYDSIITSLPSASVVFKELELPFVGRDNLQMIVAYEVESLLPFSLDDAVIDFIITQQDYEKNQSKLLVAAVRKEDIQGYMTLFEKADLSLDVATIDIFALYELYQGLFKPKNTQTPKKSNFLSLQSSSMIKLWKKIHEKISKKTTDVDKTEEIQFQPKSAELFVDIGFDVTRVLYFQNHQLISIRMIPFGASDMAQHISQNSTIAYYDVIQNILTLQHLTNIQEVLSKELNTFFEEINRTLHFFEKQHHQAYIAPEKILFSGMLTGYENFATQAQSFFSHTVNVLQPNNALQILHIKTKANHEHLSILNLSFALFEHFNQFVNFLKNIVQKKDNSLLNKQIIAIVLLTIFSFSITFWKSSTQLAMKESAYNSSKRQFIQTIQERMHIDLAQEKNIKMIVEKTEQKLKTEKNLWLAFATQQEHSLLEYLQDLSVHIDRATLHIQIKNMHLDYDKVTMSGMLKDYADIPVFQDELLELQLLQPTEQIRDLNFTLQLKPKHTKAKDETKGNRS